MFVFFKLFNNNNLKNTLKYGGMVAEFDSLKVITLCIVVLNFIWGLAVIPWLNRISKLESKVDKLTETLQTQYISKHDLNGHLKRIEDSLNTIQTYIMHNKQQ